MHRNRRRQEGRAGRAAAAPRQVAGVIPPPLLADPATADAARLRGPTQDQYYASIWSKAGQNHDDGDLLRGHKWFPLPAKAPAVEGSFFRYAKSDYIGLEIADILMKVLYEGDCNDIGDKRRQILHGLARSPAPDAKEHNLLKHELGVLMTDVAKKVKEVLESTGYAARLPEYFSKFPVLDE